MLRVARVDTLKNRAYSTLIRDTRQRILAADERKDPRRFPSGQREIRSIDRERESKFYLSCPHFKTRNHRSN